MSMTLQGEDWTPNIQWIGVHFLGAPDSPPDFHVKVIDSGAPHHQRYDKPRYICVSGVAWFRPMLAPRSSCRSGFTT